MPQARLLYVGLDVHTESIAVAYVPQDHGAEVVALGTIGTRQGALDQLIRPLHSKATALVCVYAAGPCGYGRYRDLTQPGQDGWVVAPAFMPNKAGHRGNTDRRDARPLARLMRSGDLTPVSLPQVEDDARRDLSRARADSMRDRKAAQYRLKAVLLRQDMRETGQANGSPAPLGWLAEVGCPTPAQQIVFPEYVRAVTEHSDRLQRLAQALQARGKTWRLAPVGEALQALRGGQVTVAVTTVAERGDRTRLTNPKQLMSYLGLTPSEDSSGPRRAQGGIPKTGQSHARRALLEGAWAYRSPAKGSRPRQRRLQQLPNPMQDRRWKAQGRLRKRDRQRMARGNHANHVVVALARDGVAFVGAIARELARPASTPHGARSLTERAHTWNPFSGRGAAPVWSNPRWREAAASNPRAETEAGTRRTPVRWSPIHASQRDPPSCLPGSGSSADATHGVRPGKKCASRLLPPEVIATASR
jgi:transposase